MIQNMRDLGGMRTNATCARPGKPWARTSTSGYRFRRRRSGYSGELCLPEGSDEAGRKQEGGDAYAQTIDL